MSIIRIVCRDCHGTGLYAGIVEAKGHGAVCSRCDGTGCEELVCELFISRKLRTDIQIVQLPWNRPCKAIKYKEFLRGKMPKETKKKRG